MCVKSLGDFPLSPCHCPSPGRAPNSLTTVSWLARYKIQLLQKVIYDKAWGTLNEVNMGFSHCQWYEIMMYLDLSAFDSIQTTVLVYSNKQTQSGSLPLMCNYFYLQSAVYFHNTQTQQMLVSINPLLWLFHCLMLQFLISKNNTFWKLCLQLQWIFYTFLR